MRRILKDVVSYSPPEQTLHVSVPTQLSKSLLQPNTLSIRLGTCVSMECHSDIRSSQSHILLHLLLSQAVELGSLVCGQGFHDKV